jgi:hypothetical protein
LDRNNGDEGKSGDADNHDNEGADGNVGADGIEVDIDVDKGNQVERHTGKKPLIKPPIISS